MQVSRLETWLSRWIVGPSFCVGRFCVEGAFGGMSFEWWRVSGASIIESKAEVVSPGIEIEITVGVDASEL